MVKSPWLAGPDPSRQTRRPVGGAPRQDADAAFHQVAVDFVRLDLSADPLQQGDGEFPAQMLAEIAQGGFDIEPGQRRMIESEADTFEQRQNPVQVEVAEQPGRGANRASRAPCRWPPPRRA